MSKKETAEEAVQEEKKAPKKRSSKPKVQKGVVTNCQKLNVRMSPNAWAKITNTVVSGTLLIIDLKNSTGDFYCVSDGNGLSGFCMKNYIKLL